MQTKARLSLKKGKERPILQGHFWIYSGAIAKQSGEDGDLVEVLDAGGQKLGLAFLNLGHSIAAHMIAFGEISLEESLRTSLKRAKLLREKWFNPKVTNSYRLVNAEGDGIPGLIVDCYANVLVLQISHPGIEKIRDLIVSLLVESFSPTAIFEKSTSFLRKKEGLKEVRQHLYGAQISESEILENNLRFSVDFVEGQKTGFFLDQREMRLQVKQLSENKRVLNCFSYTGGFSIAALAGGASHVDSVEVSKKCGPIINRNITLNALDPSQHRFIESDVFDFLPQSDWNYDFVILDPPAFVKKRSDVDVAFRAYKDMNQFAMSKVRSGTLLLTCSCSYHVGEELFQNILFRAALGAKRSVQIMGRHRLAQDHPISIFHPETSYLKSFLLFVSD